MQIFKTKLGSIFLRLFLCGIMFTTVITCIQEGHQSTENKTCKDLDYRLSKNVLPRHYNINITFFATLDRLNGDCEINIEIFKTTSNIRLHSPEPSRNRIKLVTKNGTACDPKDIDYYREENMLNLCFEHQLSPGNYTLLISYKKNISKDIEEDYLKILFWHAARTKQSTLVATNIHSVEARKWFPCWDEPEFKTTFQFKFNHKKKYSLWPTLSKGSSTQHDQKKQDSMWTTFIISDSISTYQVMFTITDLYFNEKYILRATSDTLHKSFHTIRSRPIVGDSMEFSEDVIVKIIDAEWYRAIPGNIMSANHIAIPAMQDDVIGKWRIILYKYSDNKFLIITLLTNILFY
ncbi:glutamyl aminopeptidase-like isoform X2 [Ooceraea biroi]|uniref:glutamyl aminopeptidase-like isoform X2 n=1 Tax=Ooceraea biroi TaxID=2015173 RepID=UPI000F08791E|nr:glutamyl aminopeptidase-like isoform X2 [Ooceraea biroi]